MMEAHKCYASYIQNTELYSLICELVLICSSNANQRYYLHVMMGELRYRQLVSKECAVSLETQHAS